MAVIELLVPTLATSRSGNTVTANRYLSILAKLGHSATIVNQPSGGADLVIALNAYRSAEGIRLASEASEAPIVVVLTGTDINRFLATHAEEVTSSLDRADRLVGLNDRIGDRLAPHHRPKLVVIKEGATPGLANRALAPATFTVAVIGHLRDEKDPEVVVRAIEDLPVGHPIVVNHYGAAHTADWCRWAQSQSGPESRYIWHGEVDRTEIDKVYASSHLLLNSSRMEGGANTISEAIMAGVAVLASDIDGNIGVLGEGYPGYFAAGDAAALRDALIEVMSDSDRLNRMTDAVVNLQPTFTVDEERRRWAALLEEMAVR